MKLVLGTVQLGLPYGINNKAGQPSRDKSLLILDCAWAQGIKIFDTAHAYGPAEDILGEFIASRNLGGQVSIISKFSSRLQAESHESPGSLLRRQLEDSLRKLKIDSLDGYLLHTPGAIRDSETMAALRHCRDRGLVRHIGVSVYEASDALYAVKSGQINYIQVPYSVFDQRLERTDFFKIAKENKIKIFARSVFLQGLVFMSESNLPENLRAARPYLREFDSIIRRYGLTREQAALLFVHANQNIDYIVIGVDNVEQLNRNLQAVKSAGNYAACWSELKDKFANIEPTVVSPNIWNEKL